MPVVAEARQPKAAAATSPADHARMPALDAVRGLAIVLVLFYHGVPEYPSEPWPGVLGRVWFAVCGCGWIGVDLFFVLSGFLITGILLDARGKAGYFRNFYGRRFLRVWPLYYALLFIVLVFIPRFRHEAHELGRFSPWYYFLFLQNLFPFGGF